MNNQRAQSVQSASPHVVVDGYNVLHDWLAGSGHAAFDDVARAGMIEALRSIRDVEQAQITVVFDGPGGVPTQEKGTLDEDISVIFASAGLTADGVIGRIVTSAPDPRRCTVVTADRLVRETSQATGAATQSPRELAAWVERCRARAARAAQVQSRAAGARFSNKLPL